jgi:hypothetical protein
VYCISSTVVGFRDNEREMTFLLSHLITHLQWLILMTVCIGSLRWVIYRGNQLHETGFLLIKTHRNYIFQQTIYVLLPQRVKGQLLLFGSIQNMTSRLHKQDATYLFPPQQRRLSNEVSGNHSAQFRVKTEMQQ